MYLPLVQLSRPAVLYMYDQANEKGLTLHSEHIVLSQVAPSAVCYVSITTSYIMQEFLDGEKKNNEEKEKAMGVMERQSIKTRLTYQEAETARLTFKNEVTNIINPCNVHIYVHTHSMTV